MKALRVSTLIAILAGPALAGDTARRPPEGELGAVSLWLYPIPTVLFVATPSGIWSLAAGGSVQPAPNVALTFEVAPSYTYANSSGPASGEDFIIAGTYFRVGTRLIGDFDDQSRAYYFIEPKLELVGFASRPASGGSFSIDQVGAFLGADVGVRFWPGSRVYVALVLGASAGVCTACNSDLFLPTNLTWEFSDVPKVSWNLNPNLLRIGWVF